MCVCIVSYKYKMVSYNIHHMQNKDLKYKFNDNTDFN